MINDFRRLSLILVMVMLVSLFPANIAYAASNNRVNKTVTVKDGKAVQNVCILIEPDAEVTSDSSIIISLNMGKFVTQEVMDGTADIMTEGYYAGGYQWKGSVVYETGQFTETEEGRLIPQVAIDDLNWEKALERNFDYVMQNSETGDLPYYLRRIGNKEMEVKLYPIPYNRVNQETSNGSSYKYRIPIPVIADGVGTIKAKIESNETTISSDEFDIATVTESKGETTITIDDVHTGVDEIALDLITIKESVAETFKLDKVVKLRLSNGFLFKPNTTMKISPGVNCSFKEWSFNVTKATDEIEFYWPADFTYTGTDPKPASVYITGLYVIPDDEDTDWGEVSLTIKGGGCTQQTILAGERTNYGFEYKASSENLMNGRRQDGSFDDELFKSGLISIKETTAGSWIPQRKLSFSVPEGVHIFDIEVDSIKNMGSLGDLSIDDGYVTINDDGDKISFENLPVDETDETELEFYLYLSADASYEGDVPLHISGGGINESEYEDVIIANFKKATDIKSSSTTGTIGKIYNPTADIVLTETKEGGFLEDGWVYVSLDSIFGAQELGICGQGDKDIKVEVTEGDLRIENVKSDEGYIRFSIKRESAEPSTITISNVAVGTTRAVPYGSYGLKVYGSGIINNFSEDTDDLGRYGWSSDTKKYVLKDYFIIDALPEDMEAATTNVVRVFIDEPDMYVNEKKFTLDVSPYIQAASDSTLVPLRAISVALNGDDVEVDKADESNKVLWDSNAKTVTIFVGEGLQQRIVQFQIGSDKMKINNAEIGMDNNVKAEIKEGRTFVPFRALGNALGVKVSWDADKRMAVYNDDGSPWPPEESTESTTEGSTETTTATTQTTTKAPSASTSKNTDESAMTVYVVGQYYHEAGCPDIDTSEAKLMSKAAAEKEGYKPHAACK